MNITIPIPDMLVAKLGGQADLRRLAFEALVLEAYRGGQLSNRELRECLGFQTRYEMDGFLKVHGIYEYLSLVEIQDQARNMERLGF